MDSFHPLFVLVWSCHNNKHPVCTTPHHAGIVNRHAHNHLSSHLASQQLAMQRSWILTGDTGLGSGCSFHHVRPHCKSNSFSSLDHHLTKLPSVMDWVRNSFFLMFQKSCNITNWGVSWGGLWSTDLFLSSVWVTSFCGVIGLHSFRLTPSNTVNGQFMKKKKIQFFPP